MPKNKEKSPQQVTKYGYIIDPEFEKVFARMTSEQHADLKEAIRREGVREPLAVWEETGILLDGHNRHRVCEELGITPPVTKITLQHTDRDQAKIWMIQNQFTRRNLNAFQRIEAALQFEPMFAVQAETNRKAGVSLNLAKGVIVVEEIAKLANASPANVKKAKKILKMAKRPEVAKALKALRRDDAGVSIHSVYVGVRGTKKSASSVQTKPIPKTKPKKRQGEKKELMPNHEQIIDRHLSALVHMVSRRHFHKEDRIYIYEKIEEWLEKLRIEEKNKK